MKEMLILGVNQIGEKEMGLLENRKDLLIRLEDKVRAEDYRTNIILTSYYDLNEDTLSKFHKLEFILAASSGYNYIDLDYAKKNGVVVSNCPDYASNSVAEHALGLILSSLRKISYADRVTRSEKWDPFLFKGEDLYGKTVGIVGYGRIGKALSGKLRLLRAKIIWIDSESSEDKRKKLFQKSDIISIHVPLKKDTVNLIDKEEFDMMKREVIFINTARGQVVNEETLIKAISQGKIKSAALDVFGNEPLSADSPLKKNDKIIITPHIAAYTTESLKKLSSEAYRTLISYLKGRPINVIKARS